MICPDVNLLLYATFRSYPQHHRAKAWWDGLLSSPAAVSPGHVVVLAADYGLLVHSNDTDFARFSGVKCVNPL